MAHRPTQRRNPVAAPQPKPTTTPLHGSKSNRSDLITQTSKPSFIVKQFSSLNLGRKHPPPLVDTRFRAKSMSASAIVDDSSSNFSFLNKPSNNNRILSPKLEKQSTLTTTKRSPKEKLFTKKKKKGNLVEDAVEIVDHKSRNRDGDVVEEDDFVVDKRKSSSVSMGSRRSRSLCGSQFELGDVFAINGVKMVSADMPPFMQIHAVDCARKALDSMEKFTSKTLALSLKKEFDGVYGPAWHCIVGNSFGSYVTHSVGGFLYFSMDHKLYILLFKTTVQKVN